MPDCLEMPYMPAIRGAKEIPFDSQSPLFDGLPYGGRPGGGFLYRIGGNSCLSGDFMGYWQFDHELQIGENIIFEDMLHYTTVTTTMFNGIGHPAIGLVHSDGELEMLREYTYEDYRDRMD